MGGTPPTLPVPDILTTAPRITFATKNVQPPSIAYVTPDDWLLIEGISEVAGETLQIKWRTLKPDGQITVGSASFPITAVNSFQSLSVFTGEGFLLDLQIANSLTTTQRGQLFVSVFLFHGPNVGPGPISAILAQSYVWANFFLVWPGGSMYGPRDGAGALLSIVGTNPAAGVEITETVPSARLWHLQSFHFQLVTSAAVATRQVQLVVDDGANIVWADEVDATQTAGQTRDYFWGDRQGSNQTAFVQNTITRSLPFLLLSAGWRIRTVTTAKDAGDDYGAPLYAVEAWVFP